MVFFGFDRLLLYLLRSRWLAPLPLFAPHAARPSVSVSSCCLLSVLFRTQCFSFQSIMYDVSLLLFICLCMSRLRIAVDEVYHNAQMVSQLHSPFAQTVAVRVNALPRDKSTECGDTNSYE